MDSSTVKSWIIYCWCGIEDDNIDYMMKVWRIPTAVLQSFLKWRGQPPLALVVGGTGFEPVTSCV